MTAPAAPSSGPKSVRTMLAVALLLAAGGALLLTRSLEPEKKQEEEKVPNEWFLVQRAWPYPDINQTARMEAHAQAAQLRALVTDLDQPWEPAGPTNVGGRIADVAAHPTDQHTCYAGAAEGGVFKTTDGGVSWFPTFDQQSSLSIGSVAVDPNNPETVYVGTGEPNGGGGSVTYGGTGVFKSTNGGVTWDNVGLPDSRYIGRVVVDPSNSNRLFVAVLGALFSTSPDRGVYRSTDAGQSWELVLASTDSTGAVDVAVHPTNSNVVYAALWERIRRPHYRTYGGPTSGLFRSTDGGDTWNELTNGLPSADVGRIGISISRSQPNIVYAIYAEADPGAFTGVYKTTNGGDTWTRTNDGALSNVYSSFGWWFGNIRVDPANPDRVFVLGLDFYRSTNGGSSWFESGDPMHVDHHGLDFGPDPSVIWEGNDGGMYLSTTGGTNDSWLKLPDLPVTQFYAIEADFQHPERLYGGTQDNGTNRTLSGALNDWTRILGGDGFHCNVDPTNNNYVYAEWQWGNLSRSTNGGNSFTSATSGLSGRINWSMPVILDPSDPTVLYCGTDRVFRATNRAVSWSAISADLTNGPGSGNLTFGTITTLAVAETDPDVIWAGTDDGNVWVTINGGNDWTPVADTLPDRWITRVAVDPTDATIGYATVSGFRWDEPLPHVFRTTDFGASWSDVSSNLPEAPVNDIVVDPDAPSTLYVATDVGVYVSQNLGGAWTALGTALPNVVVNDLELHAPTRTLIAGTYGRSMWTIDLDATTDVELAEGGAGGAGPARAPRLMPVTPNPVAAGRAAVRFELPRAARVSVRVYDATGRLVASLADGDHDAGTHRVAWDGRDTDGRPVAGGVYLVHLAGDGVAQTRKVTVTR